MKSVYWDANVFHALFNSEVGRVDICEAIQQEAENMNVIIYTSAITAVECVWLKGVPDKLSPQHEAKISAFFEHKYVRIIQCTRLISDDARRLVWKHPYLRPYDAIHVQSALKAQVDFMHTYDDKHLVKLDGKISNPPLKICHPGKGDGFVVQQQLIIPNPAPTIRKTPPPKPPESPSQTSADSN